MSCYATRIRTTAPGSAEDAGDSTQGNSPGRPTGQRAHGYTEGIAHSQSLKAVAGTPDTLSVTSDPLATAC